MDMICNEEKITRALLVSVDTGGFDAEASLAELEELLGKLEDEETPLEASFSLYEKGMKLVQVINGKIDRVEKEMTVLEGEEL